MDSKQVRGIAPVAWGGRKWAGIGAAEIMLLLVAAVWGGSYAVAKQATQQLPVLEFIALRFSLTFVVLLPALKPLFNAQWRQGIAVGGLLGANLLAIFVCETFGVSLTTASNAAFLISLCVALTPFVEWWLLGRRPERRMFWAAGLSAAGAAMLSATSPADISVGWGDGLMVIAAFLRAVMVCMTRKLAGRHSMPALTLTAVQSGVMALGAAALSLAVSKGAWHMPPATASFWWGMAYLVLLCTVFAFFAQNHAASRSSPSRVSLLMGSEPVFGAVIAVYGFGEAVGAWGWIGGLLIVVAAWWVTMPQSAESLRIP
ncbi:DMT family transporter [Variovorax sp. OV700]|jgi:drug/metabolite transporter (DMT)-like permease|uniref:DMT family transporter n=1 Tax=Variovorax sp. OV700 TaxID=1882826 RepID=UPI000880AD9D|nr:DMT family transporter [Variovorax sp. OV700]SDJ21170.1 Permease of the drug/metabolite transporter (DMT) superfamily [Variovorax sp. OV700]